MVNWIMYIEPSCFVSSDTTELVRRDGHTARIWLYDPSTGLLRYIGKATNPRHRFTCHVNPEPAHRSTHKGCWIGTLRDKGLLPIIKVFEWVPCEGWEEVERAYIAEARRVGADLTNLSTGGDGGVGPMDAPGARAKVSAAQKGRVRTQAQKDAVSAFHTGRKDTEDVKARRRESLRAYYASPEARKLQSIKSRKRFETPTPTDIVVPPLTKEHT